MAIVGFSFSKFDCVRNEISEQSGTGIEINHNISIVDVKKTKLNIGTNKDDVLKIDFTFNVTYGQNLGDIKISGNVIFADIKEIISETFKSWTADKKLSSIVNEEVLKFVYLKVSIRALELADNLNLPSPIPLPKLNFSNKKN